METITLHLKNKEQIQALKNFMKAFDISFEVKKNKSSNYNSEYVDMILESNNQVNEGKITYIKTKDLWK